MRTALTRLTLTDFRSYERAELALDGRPLFLVGPNGAGKTNLLEAVSLLTPGRGLRGASLAEVGRRLPGEPRGRAWAVAAAISADGEETRLGTGVAEAGAPRRTVRLEGETVPPGRLAEHLREVWLTPAQDRLFLEGAGERRRFFDRLVFAAEPAHASHAQSYERALRERMRLLTEGSADAAWLDALEARLAEAGALMAEARARTLSALQAEIAERGERPFPQARLSFAGEWEQLAAAGAAIAEIETRLLGALKAARPRDAAAGRALTGPHRGDLAVVHTEKDRPAAECSTGEQKALVLNLVLAQAARLARVAGQPSPILLLDEVAAHLDARRRAALFDEIEATGLQAFLTGTDAQLFEALAGRAQGVRVEASGLAAL
ncbi:MAG TPA: DNA replication/repair protein RecF [Solirubrobacterales bacterium]|uniref:DNA replication/repair protein RecF n=1 Tax=Phenylobacterium sp. TaxID=1871053 RepID=UPI00260581C9|nr:DNA replication/repair protein RecF [Phenylobacterium sp.]HET9185296.1 DNA replication/repair protein RecF [Solirubrobacterales bacterium]